MLTASEEATLIAAAQAGDNEAAERLYAEYRPNIRAIAHRQYPGDDDNARQLREECEAELHVALWQAVQDFDPAVNTRLMGLFKVSGALSAVDKIDGQLLPLSVPTRTVRKFRQARRIAENLHAGEACERCGEHVADAYSGISHALAHVEMSLSTYTELLGLLDSPSYADADEGHKNRFGETVGAYTERSPEESVAMAEVALDALTGLQHFLTVHKYGFEKDAATGEYVTLPRQYVNTGRPDAEVADYYNQTAADDKPLTQTGADTLSRATVQREIVTGHVAARAAINEWFNGGVA